MLINTSRFQQSSIRLQRRVRARTETKRNLSLVMDKEIERVTVTSTERRGTMRERATEREPLSAQINIPRAVTLSSSFQFKLGTIIYRFAS